MVYNKQPLPLLFRRNPIPYVRLTDGIENSASPRYISQTPSGVVGSQAQATNFSTVALARNYMKFAYPNVVVASGWFNTPQSYILEDATPVKTLPGNAL